MNLFINYRYSTHPRYQISKIPLNFLLPHTDFRVLKYYLKRFIRNLLKKKENLATPEALLLDLCTCPFFKVHLHYCHVMLKYEKTAISDYFICFPYSIANSASQFSFFLAWCMGINDISHSNVLNNETVSYGLLLYHAQQNGLTTSNKTRIYSYNYWPLLLY